MADRCPACGKERRVPSKGRPRKIDDREVARMVREGLSLGDMARELGVTRGAVQWAVRRLAKARRAA